MSQVAAAAPLPAARYRFVALGVVWCAYLVVFLSRLCVGPLSPFLKDSFDLSNAQIGGLTSATAVAYMPTLVLAGWLADRIGVRRALIIGTLITGVSVGAVAFAPSYGVMVLLLACSGFGCGFIYPTAVKAIMLWFPQRERATAVGVNQSAVNVSGMLGAAIMPALALSFGWQSGFVLASVMAFAICGVAIAFYREPRPGESAAEREAWPAAGLAEPEQGLPLVTGDACLDRAAVNPGFLAVVRSRDILLLGFAAMFLCMVEFSALAHLVLFLKVDWAYTAVAAGGLLAFCQAAGAIGKPLSGLLSDRLLGGRRRSRRSSRSPPSPVLACVDPGAAPARADAALLWVGAGPDGPRGGGVGRPVRHAGRRDRRPRCRRRRRRRHRRHRQHRHLHRAAALRLDRRRTGSYAPAWWTMVGAAGLRRRAASACPRATRGLRGRRRDCTVMRGRTPAGCPPQFRDRRHEKGRLPARPFTWLPSRREGEGLVPSGLWGLSVAGS